MVIMSNDINSHWKSELKELWVPSHKTFQRSTLPITSQTLSVARMLAGSTLLTEVEHEEASPVKEKMPVTHKSPTARAAPAYTDTGYGAGSQLVVGPGG